MGQQAFLSSHEFYSRNVSCSIVTPYCKILSIASTNSVCLPAFRSSFSFFRYCSGRFRPFLWYCSTKRPSIRMGSSCGNTVCRFSNIQKPPRSISAQNRICMVSPAAAASFSKSFFLPRAQKAAVINNKFLRLFFCQQIFIIVRFIFDKVMQQMFFSSMSTISDTSVLGKANP